MMCYHNFKSCLPQFYELDGRQRISTIYIQARRCFGNVSVYILYNVNIMSSNIFRLHLLARYGRDGETSVSIVNRGCNCIYYSNISHRREWGRGLGLDRLWAVFERHVNNSHATDIIIRFSPPVALVAPIISYQLSKTRDHSVSFTYWVCCKHVDNSYFYVCGCVGRRTTIILYCCSVCL